MKTVLEWHTMDEKTPEHFNWCLVVVGTDAVSKPYISTALWSEEFGWICEPKNIKEWITHWTHFPKVPKAKVVKKQELIQLMR